MLSSLRSRFRGFLKRHFEVSLPELSAEENQLWTESAARSATGIFMIGLGLFKFGELHDELPTRLLFGFVWTFLGLVQLFLFRQKPLPIRQPQFWLGSLLILSFFGIARIPMSQRPSLVGVAGVLLFLFGLVSFGLACQARAATNEAVKLALRQDSPV
jgi:hypothetical protein